MRLKIAIVVPGRFHAFDLAEGLLARGEDVTVFTTYPARAVARFGFPAARVRRFVWHGIFSRVLGRLPSRGPIRRPEAWLHRLFGRWAARQLAKDKWDIVHTWSGVSEEVLRSYSYQWGITLLMRGSAHVRAQSRLLEEESRRSGAEIDRPTPWMIARETREYALADQVVVLSTFARRTFEAEGFPPQKLSLVPLGVRTTAFRPDAEMIAARQRRLRSGAPLRVLYVGLLSYRKGLMDLAAVVKALAGDRFHFRFVGAALPEAAGLVAELRGKADIVGKVPQHALPAIYNDADVFVFPTIEDGYAAVLAQAKAAGLPIIATPNSAGRDLLTPDHDGWIVPIRSPGAIIERLRHCEADREGLAAMTRAVYEGYQPRDWTDVARDVDNIYARLVRAHQPVAAHG